MKVKIGKFLVHPVFGVCEVTDIYTDEFKGEDTEFVVLQSSSENMEHILPYKSLDDYMLRPVIKKAEVQDLFQLMKKSKADINLTGAKSYKLNSERSKSGLPEDMVISLASLSIRHSTGVLIPTERQLLMHIRKKMIYEYAISLKTNIDNAEKKLNDAIMEVIPKDAKVSYEEALTHIALKNNKKNNILK